MNYRSLAVLSAAAHKMILSARLDAEGNKVDLRLDDGSLLTIQDDAAYCCETRWLTTDDDLSALVGHRFLGVEEKDGPSEDREGDWGDGIVHDTAFVEIVTDGGFATLVTHNEHNGYYSGFDLVAFLSSP